MQSNWSRNELTGSAKLGYNDYFQLPSASAPYGSGVVDYRFDASRDLSFDTEGRYNIASETGAQLGLGGATTRRADAGLDLWRDGGRDRQVRRPLDRPARDARPHAIQGGGQLATDDYNDYGLKLRASYR